MKYGKVILGIVILVLVLGASTLLYNQLKDNYKPKEPNTLSAKDEGEEAPADSKQEEGKEEAADNEEEEKTPAVDFTAVDLDDKEIKLSDHFGKPIVLNFWASWCGPCKSEMPDFQKAFESAGEDITFMMVNLTDGSRETKETAKAFIEEQGYTFPVYFDTAQEAAYGYGVSSVPMTFFIDADGNIAAYAKGMLDADSLEKGIKMIQ